MMAQLLFLSGTEVAQALPMADAIAGMKSAYRQLSTGQAEMPLRARVKGEHDGVALLMPAYLRESRHMGIKLLTVYPNNIDRPIIHALVLALDATTGEPLALMEGGVLTAIRTGAGSGAATDVLAREDSTVVAIIGSGVQARTQLEAVCTVRPIERVLVYSRTPDHAAAFAESMRGVGTIPDDISVTKTANDAVRQADIVCTATTSPKPVFEGEALQAGTHINAVGSYQPTMREVDALTLQRSRIFIDSQEGIRAEAGEIIQALAEGSLAEYAIRGEIGAVLAGTTPGRTGPNDITYFKSVGVAVQDAIAAHIALVNARKNQIGQFLEL